MAAGESDVNLRRSLECDVCQELYTSPKTLACGHTFCQQCLIGWAMSSLDYVNSVSCPSCRHVCSLPNKDVASLKTNITLEKLCEEVRDKVTTSCQPSSDGLCHKHQKPLVNTCLRCKPILTLCSECSSAHVGVNHVCTKLDIAAQLAKKQVNSYLDKVNEGQIALLDIKQEMEEWSNMAASNVDDVTTELLNQKKMIVSGLEKVCEEMVSTMQRKVTEQQKARHKIMKHLQEQLETADKLIALGAKCTSNTSHLEVLRDKAVFDSARGQFQEVNDDRDQVPRGLWILGKQKGVTGYCGDVTTACKKLLGDLEWCSE